MLVRAVGLKISSPKGVAEVGALDMVGDGTNSESRGGGSFRDSVFQIPELQGNELLPTFPQEREPPMPGLVVAPQAAWSAAGLVGLDGPPVVREAFRLAGNGISLSHDVRRAGLGCGALVDAGVNCGCSPSSSDEAKASESGVERRTPG